MCVGPRIMNVGHKSCSVYDHSEFESPLGFYKSTLILICKWWLEQRWVEVC